jgi:hypothetical protein
MQPEADSDSFPNGLLAQSTRLFSACGHPPSAVYSIEIRKNRKISKPSIIALHGQPVARSGM